MSIKSWFLLRGKKEVFYKPFFIGKVNLLFFKAGALSSELHFYIEMVGLEPTTPSVANFLQEVNFKPY